MVVKGLREIYSVDTISQDKGWKKIRESVNVDDELTIDFTGINVIEPWACAEFKKMLTDTNVNLRFTNEEEMVNRIKMMCIIDELNPDRVENIHIEIPKKETPEEKKIKRIADDLKQLIEIVNNVGHLDLTKKYTQVSSSNTIVYVGHAIRAFAKENNIKEFIIETKKMDVQTNILESVADLIVSLEDENIKIDIDTDIEDIQKNMGLYMHKATARKYDEKARYEVLLNKVKPGAPGILIRYKKSNAVDDFGRHGKGQVVSSRIAIFKGFTDNNDTESDSDIPLAVFETFNDETFYTKQHWMIEHDNDVPNGLNSDIVEMTMEELGVGDLFLGSQFHFLRAVQQDISENRVVIVDTDENGRNIKETCSIPRRMQIVFDDWNIKYNKDALEKDIAETKKKLNL